LIGRPGGTGLSGYRLELLSGLSVKVVVELSARAVIGLSARAVIELSAVVKVQHDSHTWYFVLGTLYFICEVVMLSARAVIGVVGSCQGAA